MRLPPELLLSAYSQGWFPMAHEDGELYWHEPDPRTILPLDAFHIPRSLVRTLKKEAFEIRRDTAFTAVIQACAAPAPGREETWINADILEGYQNLHRLGYAHSIEAWHDGQLVGGLYGVALRGLFAGESMFSHETDASKVALVHLVQHLRARGFQLLDVQYMTPHLRRFGAVEISAAAYQRLLAKALAVDANF
ncbi:MAG: leucyl/phenylalanyl-tRNA--protein transferase [Chloroflexi bacterium]|nr:leucyl/phenylalanyl-tRNA--protein transferase [Chloroflexota bacterium]